MKSAFIIFDITNPEKKPVLLGEISMPNMGFATNYPTMVVMRDGDHDGSFEDYNNADPTVVKIDGFLPLVQDRLMPAANRTRRY